MGFISLITIGVKMKFLLSMIICTSVYQQCLPPHTMPEIYPSHYECMIAGYEESMKKAKEIGPEEINKYGTIIKFSLTPIVIHEINPI